VPAAVTAVLGGDGSRVVLPGRGSLAGGVAAVLLSAAVVDRCAWREDGVTLAGVYLDALGLDVGRLGHHDAEQGEDRMTSNGTWTPEAIRALGPTTDVPTLGTIFECSRWKSYQMARHGEWERVGIKVIPIGSKYRVVVESILDVLRYGCGDVGA
jgi:hypothetical protein